MAKCHICGQPTDSGSVCRHCRAALARLRERTAPAHGDGRPALALAGASVGGGTASTAGPAMGTGRSFLNRRKELAAAVAARTAATPEPASGSRSTRWFPVVGMGLLVVIGAVAVYQLVDSGSTPVPVSAVALPAEPPAPPAAVRVLEMPEPVPAAVPEALAEAPKGAQPPMPAQIPTPAHTPTTVAIPRRAPLRPAPETEAARNADDVHATRPPPPAPRLAARADSPAAVATAQPVSAPMPVPAAAAPKGRWERMDAALEECSRREFLGRLICREKARLEYCEGQWGKVDRCPGSTPIDRGG